LCARDTQRVVADLGTLSHDSQNAESWGLLGSTCGKGGRKVLKGVEWTGWGVGPSQLVIGLLVYWICSRDRGAAAGWGARDNIRIGNF